VREVRLEARRDAHRHGFAACRPQLEVLVQRPAEPTTAHHERRALDAEIVAQAVDHDRGRRRRRGHGQGPEPGAVDEHVEAREVTPIGVDVALRTAAHVTSLIPDGERPPIDQDQLPEAADRRHVLGALVHGVDHPPSVPNRARRP
jgi:hypothetical protein